MNIFLAHSMIAEEIYAWKYLPTYSFLIDRKSCPAHETGLKKRKIYVLFVWLFITLVVAHSEESSCAGLRRLLLHTHVSTCSLAMA